MKAGRDFLSRVPIMGHSLVDFVQWDTLSSSVDPAIDAQDRAIVHLADEASALRRRGTDGEALRQVAERASRVLAGHFRTEERLLAEIGYPGRDRHFAEHQQLLADLSLIRDRLENGDRRGTRRAATDLANFMIGVTLGHMANSDGDYCRYLADAMARDSTGCA